MLSDISYTIRSLLFDNHHEVDRFEDNFGSVLACWSFSSYKMQDAAGGAFWFYINGSKRL